MNASKPVLIAYDGSEGAKAAVEAAGRLFPDRPAVVVSVWHPAADIPAASLIAIPAGVATSAYEALDKESESQATEKADEGATAAKDLGLDATPSTLRSNGQVWATIVRAADQEDAEAIVVGSRGLSGVKSALLGSVANGVVHHSTRPVVVIPAPSN
ncbi:MAG TPA: universal stress protein [Thermoleophilaceae bacterium]|nr:universal stress protein [Thermoleophilaceae bacterium]